jgi:hypothetical protein
MTDDRLAILAAGHELAQLYGDAVQDLNRHWPDEDGVCLGCGDNYPCAEEWITQRAIAGIEARWRRYARRLADLTETGGTDPAPPSDSLPA